jgi:glycine oxidase
MVVVIGAGIIGCAVAHELARRGFRVTVIDPRAEGEGATHASGGMLVPYVEAEASGPMLPLGAASLALFDEFVAAVADEDHQVEYCRTGSLQVAFTEEAVASLRSTAAHLQHEGVEIAWAEGDAVCGLQPGLSNDARAGLLIRPHGLVAAAALNRALWRAAERHGATRMTTRAVRVSQSGGGAAVETPQGPIAASHVVVAAGAWSPQVTIDGDAAAPMRPIRGQLLVLKWPSEALRTIVWGPRCYLVPWQNGTLLVGATAEDVGFDERTTVAGVHDLLDAAAELAPDAWRAEFLGARVGLRPATSDGLPILGRSPAIDRVCYATGHFRNGVLLAPITARLIADLVEHGREDSLLEPFSPRRFLAG